MARSRDPAGGIEADLQRIERELDYTLASADLEAASTLRLWSLAGLAALLSAAMLLGAEQLTLSESVRVLAIVAGASAAWHIATWTMIRIWLRIVHER